ncbi:MAG: tetratricopeptide repeat protein [Ardenticatenaceae bacterium]
MTHILDLTQSLADRFYHEGIGFEEMGRLDEAMHAFERAVQAKRTHAAARIALAYHCRRLDRIDKAVAHSKAAVVTEPGAEAYFTLGHMLTASHEYENALAALRRCLELDPSYEQARYQIAFVYYLKGEYDVAITEFHRAAQHEPDWETLFFLGECYRMTRRPAEAERIFRRALNMASSWGQVEITRGQLRACQRLTEFPPHVSLSIKDRAYSDCGIVYLGTRADDGLNIPPYLFFRYEYVDIAHTLYRFLALAEAQGWTWDAVMPVDIISLPLALALASSFGTGTEPLKEGKTLVVQALGETVEGLQDATERLNYASTFCLLACWPEEWRPDFVGVVTPLVGSLPWYRTSTLSHLRLALAGDQNSRPPSREIWQDPRPPEVIARDILTALANIADEPTLPAQLEYYQQHQRLRWL